MNSHKQPINLRFAEKLFLHVLKDLAQRRTSTYLYDRINCGRLLRQLLIDGDVLTLVANRRVRAPLFFTLTKYGEPKRHINIPEECLKYLIKDPGECAYLQPVKMDNYLDHRIANYGDNDISVRDLIKYVANNYGGVHLDPGQDDKVKMHLVDQTIHVNGEGAIFALLSSVIVTTLAALYPIRDALLEALLADNDKMLFGEESKVIASIPIPNSTNEKVGTLSVWLKSKVDQEWYKSDKQKSFPPMKNHLWELQIHKDESRQLHVNLLGLLGKDYAFTADVPDYKTVSPQHGVHVLIAWDYPVITLYLQGKEIERKEMEDLRPNETKAKRP